MIRLNLVQNLRARYLVGLTAIALLVTASFLTMQRVVSAHRNYAGVIALAGRQAGLANRIAYFSSLMATTEDSKEFTQARFQVGTTIEKIRTAHKALRNGDPQNNIPKISNEILIAMYEDPLTGLDRALSRFLTRAGQVYDNGMETLHPESAAYLFLTTYGPNVLEPMLETAVTEYEKIGRDAIVHIERVELLLWISAIVTLVLELTFIFRPLERRVERALVSLEDSVGELTNTRRRLLDAQKISMVGDWEMDIPSGQIHCSEQVYDICGVSPQTFDLSKETVMTLVHPEDRRLLTRNLRNLFLRGKSMGMEIRIIRPGGGECLVFQQAQVIGKSGGRIEKIAGTVQNITRRRELSVRLEKLSSHIPGFIFEFHRDENGETCFPYTSAGIEETCNLRPEDLETQSQPLLDRLHDRDKDRVLHKIETSAKTRKTWKDQFRFRHPDKGVIWLEGHATPEQGLNSKTLWYGYIWDITERKTSEKQIRKLALYDPLTGLANRRLIMERLSQAIASAGRHKNYGAVLMLDMDNFKGLNDTKGHDVGDALLIEVAGRILSCVRETDMVGRLGGDEFVVILELLGTDEAHSKEAAMAVGEKIRGVLNQTYVLDNSRHTHRSSSSVGVVLFHNSGVKGSEVLKQADVAMYEAKDQGRNRTCFYTEDRQILINDKIAMAHELPVALDNREFCLYYQPQVLNNGRVCGAEVLLRWQPPEKPEVLPTVFIPMAEKSGLILALGQWVLEKACRDLHRLNQCLGHGRIPFSVNISAKQLMDETFVRKVGASLDNAGISPGQLKLEITETCLAQDMIRARALLTELRTMGLGIELDDFGTGYSSLHAVNEFPLTALKLDRSLIQGIDAGQKGQGIVKAALAMAKALSLDTIAEGVETRGQEGFLVNEGCEMLQGFLYAKPMPFDDLVPYIEKHLC